MIKNYLNTIRRCGYYNQRLSRTPYLLTLGTNALIVYMVSGIPVVYHAAMTALIVITLLTTIQRLNDTGTSRWSMLIMLSFPPFSFIACVILFSQSHLATNRYGPYV